MVLFGNEFDADEGAEVGRGLLGGEAVDRHVGLVVQRVGMLDLAEEGRVDGRPIRLEQTGDFVAVHGLVLRGCPEFGIGCVQDKSSSSGSSLPYHLENAGDVCLNS